MTVQTGDARSVDRALSRLFSLGTRIATILIAIGCAFQLVGSRTSIGPDLSWLGVAIFVLLPGAGVLTMCVLHVRKGRYTLGSIAAVILLVILGAALVSL